MISVTSQPVLQRIQDRVRILEIEIREVDSVGASPRDPSGRGAEALRSGSSEADPATVRPSFRAVCLNWATRDAGRIFRRLQPVEPLEAEVPGEHGPGGHLVVVGSDIADVVAHAGRVVDLRLVLPRVKSGVREAGMGVRGADHGERPLGAIRDRYLGRRARRVEGADHSDHTSGSGVRLGVRRALDEVVSPRLRRRVVAGLVTDGA